MMKAFNRNVSLTTAQEVFNYRLSRARLNAETSFGRLVARFRIFHRPIEVSLNTCDVIVKTCCVLHNYLSQDTSAAPDPNRDQTPDRLPQTITPLSQQEMSSYKNSCKYRDNLCKYCVTDGEVPYQWSKIIKKKLNISFIFFFFNNYYVFFYWLSNIRFVVKNVCVEKRNAQQITYHFGWKLIK